MTTITITSPTTGLTSKITTDDIPTIKNALADRIRNGATLVDAIVDLAFTMWDGVRRARPDHPHIGLDTTDFWCDLIMTAITYQGE